MNSLFRIDRNSIGNDELESAGVVVIPGFHELAKEQETETEAPRTEEEARVEQPIDLKKKELLQMEQKIEEAKARAGQLIADAESKAEATLKQAEHDGYAEGLRRAEDELKKEIEQERLELGELKKKLVAARDEMLREMETSVLDLSLCVSEKVVRETLDRNDKVFLNIVRDMLSKVKEQSDIVLKVSQKEYERFFADDKDEFTALLKSSGIQVKQDLAVEHGECVIETGFGALRSGIDMQHRRIAEALYEADGA